MKFSNLYDKKSLLRYLLMFAGVSLLMRFTGGTGFIVVIPLVYMALIGNKTESLFFWLLVAVCMLIINPHIVSKNSIFAWSQRGLMLSIGAIMAIQVFGHRQHTVLRPFGGMLLYILYMIFPSIQGWCPPVSILKLILFTVIYFTLFGVANRVGTDTRIPESHLRSIMLCFAIIFVLGSTVLVPFPALSQLKASDFINQKLDLNVFTSLFIGMANHSQSLGPIVASISTIVFADLLFSIKKFDLLYVAILICCPYLVYLTSSRTGMATYVMGMVFVFYLFSRARNIRSSWKNKIVSLAMLLIVLLAAAILFSSGFSNATRSFLTKKVDADDVTFENVTSTRMGLVDDALQNFKEKPLIGNGFQVDESMIGLEIGQGASMLSAPIEKGVWVTAVLEEGGIFGFLILVGFMIHAFLSMLKQRAYCGIGAFAVCILSNFGEFTLFSMSYTGGFVWAMVFVGLSFDIVRRKREMAVNTFYQRF